MTTTPSKKSWTGWGAWGVFLLTFVIIGFDVVRRPHDHTTTPTYRFASTQWWQGLDPYTFDQTATPIPATNTPDWMVHHDQFLYFPQAAVLFTPFNVLPFMAGEILWRVATFGLFAYALVRLNRFFLASRSRGREAVDAAARGPHSYERGYERTFLFLALLAIPSSFASLRNAQFDLPLAALIVLAAAEIASARWTPAAVWLCLALALKPLALVPMLLFGALNWKLIPRLLIGTMIVIAVPFLHWSPTFVAHEYARSIQALGWASAGDAPKFSDLSALLSKFGFNAPETLKTVTRVLFALVYLGLGALAVRRLNRPSAAWTIGALSADYLMLFNPRTETCSYVFLGPFVASLALLYTADVAAGVNPWTPGKKIHALTRAATGRKWLGRVLGFFAICLACDAFPKIATFSLHDMTDRWLKPLIALVFLPIIWEYILHHRDPNDRGTPA